MRRGVTLLEMLIALAMTSLILAAIGRAYVTGMDFERRSQVRRIEDEARMRFEERLRELLRGAYVSADAADTATYFMATANTGSTADGTDMLVFTAKGDLMPTDILASTDDFETLNTDRGPQGGIVELQLSMEAIGQPTTQEEGLYLREQRPSDGDPEQGGTESLLEAGISEIRFEFFDGLQWLPEWDTAETGRRIPAVVRVHYTVGEEEEERNLVIKLPQSDVTVQNPVEVAEAQ